MKFIVLTLFPEMIFGGLSHSILKRACDAGAITLECVDIRGFAENKHNRCDDYPYGGGCGMVMSPGPVYRSVLFARQKAGEGARLIYMTPRGKPFNQNKASELSKAESLVVLCGHYEGIDERVIEEIQPEEISLGDFVLTGGELAAMAVIDAVSRLVPGVLSNPESGIDESFSEGLLEYPQYTRPPEFMGRAVPEILLSGHHENIRKWRRDRAVEMTRRKRPDLLEKPRD